MRRSRLPRERLRVRHLGGGRHVQHREGVQPGPPDVVRLRYERSDRPAARALPEGRQPGEQQSERSQADRPAEGPDHERDGTSGRSTPADGAEQYAVCVRRVITFLT